MESPKGFNQARQKAEKLLNKTSDLQTLLKDAVSKAANKSKVLSGFWEDLQTLLRMAKAYATGVYKDVSTGTIVWAVAAIVYFVNPIDLIPDFIIGFGFVDDATVIGFVIKNIKTEIDQFTVWENAQKIES
ncbi:MAG: uncharacterized membrane protein YkvA (DUF1232 family) [Bacteroidia bacterium]|jgi:uncharacterized membrane protein YkvA (DUF1232 family)